MRTRFLDDLLLATEALLVRETNTLTAAMRKMTAKLIKEELGWFHNEFAALAKAAIQVQKHSPAWSIVLRIWTKQSGNWKACPRELAKSPKKLPLVQW